MESKPLPDSSTWRPHKQAAETLASAFLHRCIGVEQEILLRAEFEQRMSIHNFDSGLPVEEIVRGSLRQLLPLRYSVRAGVLVDRQGLSAGDCDLVIFNDLWFPTVKSGPTPESRRTYLPIEGAYAVGEVKQRLDEDTLDSAMQKLVTAHRLHRPSTHRHRLVENRSIDRCRHGLSNPLFSFVLAAGLRPGTSFESLINRFYDINKQVKRLEVVRALCVLGEGCVVWGFRQGKTEVRPALFMLEDLYLPLIPVYFKASYYGSALYALMASLTQHLYHSVLAPEDLVPSYGLSDHAIVVPDSEIISLLPDPEWMDLLNTPCTSNSDDRRDQEPGVLMRILRLR
jgi:hypothetical protein